jgi:hypothetical protein
MESFDIEVVKKEIMDKVDKLGDSYSTFSFKNKIVINHEVEKDLSCQILLYEDLFDISIYFYDKVSFIYRHLLRMKAVSYDRLDYFLNCFADFCDKGNRLAKNIYNYIDSLPNLKVDDIEESTISEHFNEHFSNYGLVQYGRVLIGRYIGTICIRDCSNLEVSILENGERVIFCKPVNQTNYIELFKEVDELLADVMKNLPSDIEYFRRLQNEVE